MLRRYSDAKKETNCKLAGQSSGNFDGDGRDEAYWNTREFLLSYPVVREFISNGGGDAIGVLEILVHASLIGVEADSRFGHRSRAILDKFLPMFTAELDKEELLNSPPQLAL